MNMIVCCKLELAENKGNSINWQQNQKIKLENKKQIHQKKRRTLSAEHTQRKKHKREIFP